MFYLCRHFSPPSAKKTFKLISVFRSSSIVISKSTIFCLNKKIFLIKRNLVMINSSCRYYHGIEFRCHRQILNAVNIFISCQPRIQLVCYFSSASEKHEIHLSSRAFVNSLFFVFHFVTNQFSEVFSRSFRAQKKARKALLFFA